MQVEEGNAIAVLVGHHHKVTKKVKIAGAFSAAGDVRKKTEGGRTGIQNGDGIVAAVRCVQIAILKTYGGGDAFVRKVLRQRRDAFQKR